MLSFMCFAYYECQCARRLNIPPKVCRSVEGVCVVNVAASYSGGQCCGGGD